MRTIEVRGEEVEAVVVVLFATVWFWGRVDSRRRSSSLFRLRLLRFRLGCRGWTGGGGGGGGASVRGIAVEMVAAGAHVADPVLKTEMLDADMAGPFVLCGKDMRAAVAGEEAAEPGIVACGDVFLQARGGVEAFMARRAV